MTSTSYTQLPWVSSQCFMAIEQAFNNLGSLQTMKVNSHVLTIIYTPHTQCKEINRPRLASECRNENASQQLWWYYQSDASQKRLWSWATSPSFPQNLKKVCFTLRDQADISIHRVGWLGTWKRYCLEERFSGSGSSSTKSKTSSIPS